MKIKDFIKKLMKENNDILQASVNKKINESISRKYTTAQLNVIADQIVNAINNPSE